MRPAIQAALAASGLMDLAVRVVARRPTGTAVASADEADFLVRQLAGRRDWAALWQLAQDLPLSDSAAAVQLVSDGWQPADDDARRVFNLLASTRHNTIAAFGARSVNVIRVKADGRVFRSVFFSPDESEVGVLDASCRVRVYWVADGRRVRKSLAAGSNVREIVHLGDAVVVSRWTELANRCFVVRRRWDGPREVLLRTRNLCLPTVATDLSSHTRRACGSAARAGRGSDL
jgi:hypothetical protein